MKPFCGPKCSLCCTLISAWGIVQLGLMGVFFAIRSPAFIEDLSIPAEAEDDPRTYLQAMDDSYYLIAKNCGVAAGLYVVTMALSGWQWYLHMQS